MIKVIVFDFDGVLVDSNALKYNAFFKLFPDLQSQKIVKEVMQEIGDRTRFKILSEIMRRLGKPSAEIEDLTLKYAGLYSEMVQREILEKGFIPGALETLKNLSGSYNLYINSSTPEIALREILARLNLNRFLKASYGRIAEENPKESNLRKIIAAENVKGEEVLMVGDTEADCEAAQNCGCRFIGIRSDLSSWDKTAFPLLPDLIGLEEIINSLS